MVAAAGGGGKQALFQLRAAGARLPPGRGAATRGAMPVLLVLLRLLPTRLRPLATPARLLLAAQFLRFGTVGAVGFVLDTAVVYALRAPVGLYAAGIVSYLAVGSVNFALNRLWTFRGGHRLSFHRQWALFLAANAIGFVLNRGTYVALIATSPLCLAYPVLAVAAGSLAGMTANFTLSRRLVFT